MKLNEYDKELVWKMLPAKTRRLVKENPNTVFLAGGFIGSCIMNRKISDVDLFAEKPVADAITNAIKAANSDVVIIKTKNAHTIRKYDKHPIQIIHRWPASSADEVIKCFDFVCCQAVMWYDTKWETLCSDYYYSDNMANRLTYTMPQRDEEVGGSLLRVLKYYQKGYRIPLEDLAYILANVFASVDFEKVMYALRADPGMSEREHLAKIIKGVLYEVDPNTTPRDVVIRSHKDKIAYAEEFRVERREMDEHMNNIIERVE